MDGLCLKAAGIHAVSSQPASAVEVRSNPSKFSAVGCASANGMTSSEKPSSSSFPRLFTGNPLRSLWPGNRSRPRNGLAVDDAVVVADDGGERGVVDSGVEPWVRDSNWAVKILHLRSRRAEEEKKKEVEGAVVLDLVEKEAGGVVDQSPSGCDAGEEGEECDVCRVDDDGDDDEAGKEGALDRDSFSRLLRRVTLAEAKFYAQMSYLGNLAYSIPNIKPGNLLRHYGLRLVTSSIEKKELSTKCENDQTSIEVRESEGDPKDAVRSKEQNNTGYLINAFAAYQFAASAASYLHSCTKNILPFKFLKGKACPDSQGGGSLGNNCVDIMNPEMASIIVTTDSVTAVVAAEEEVKQAVANNLNSTRSSPCEWFICDDDQSGTRFFVIQGSESLASWQANLLFEPIQLEGLDVLVHRGIYEAAKGMYEQMLPEVQAHLKSRGDLATFRFTGHSLGGSLALLINLMLLIRGEVPLSALLPVITFGSPSIMCGGNRLLHKLGLPRSHLQAITMHRDIVPRAFSCNYPKRVAELLKAVNGNFRNHPCLNNQKLLYAPMGELLILQPEGKFSPHHHLLPAGSGLYLLNCPLPDSSDAEKQILAAQIMFLNSPHPLEILSDRSSYGSDGTIHRDHDINSYVRSVQGVVRRELRRIRKSKKERRHKLWWSIVTPQGAHTSVIARRPMASLSNMGEDQFNFSGILQTGRKSLKRFTRLVASQHMHLLLVVFLFPARLLLLGTFSGMNFR